MIVTMTVEELIYQLQKEDPKAEIVHATELHDYCGTSRATQPHIVQKWKQRDGDWTNEWKVKEHMPDDYDPDEHGEYLPVIVVE